MSNDNLYAVFSERFVGTDTFIRSPDGSDLYSYADLDHYAAVYADRLKALGALPETESWCRPKNLLSAFFCISLA